MSAEALPPDKRKFVDPKAPAPLRSMGAKGLAPMAPPDMITALFMLAYDPDEKIRDTAVATAAGLADRVLAPALREERVPPLVLGWFLDLFWEKDAYAEMLILNSGTPDEAVARVASKCGVRTAEIVAGNQLRLLRHEDIVRQLALNPSTEGALIDGVCDFSVRSGLVLADVPQMKAARVRLYGPEAAEAPPDPGPTADSVIAELGVGEESSAPMEEGKRLTLSQRIMKMNIAEKIKLATKGNKEARSILIRDSNKLVAVAVIRSPRITDGEVLMQANNKTAQEEILRIICADREWTKMYPVKLALVRNPKVPQAIGMRFLSTLRETDVKNLARDRNVPNVIQMTARKMVAKKDEPKKEEK
ncbi:MAG: hypothetical protein JNK82_41990 [Myxococcaceae bacterium]|nr:hypothetical protein [Myxococcaceae bacterium]